MKSLIHVIKGIFIGISTLIPGMGGGTTALVLGVYHRMIKACSSFFKDIKGNLFFLSKLALGALIGFVLVSKFMGSLMDKFYFPIIYLFIGMILGSVPFIYKKTNVKGKSSKDLIFLLIGFLFLFLISMSKSNLVDFSTLSGWINYLFLFIAGFITAIAFVLPGMSTSAFLLTLGLYELTIEAINKLQIDYLISLCLGIFIGTILILKLVERCFEKHPRKTYLLILGFVLGSLIEIYPGLPQGFDILLSILSFILGFFIILFVSKRTKE
ncbi:MAG: DUF368 domain-containing protein [Mollicutes bacterium]|nr:DUF368 domain-containing protein [Mollicutes bacterium]